MLWGSGGLVSEGGGFVSEMRIFKIIPIKDLDSGDTKRNFAMSEVKRQQR